MFTKLRISSHNLHSETGRHNRPKKTPVENRMYVDIVIIILLEILKMKCTLFVTVNYMKIYVPNLKKYLILCNFFRAWT